MSENVDLKNSWNNNINNNNDDSVQNSGQYLQNVMHKLRFLFSCTISRLRIPRKIYYKTSKKKRRFTLINNEVFLLKIL